MALMQASRQQWFWTGLSFALAAIVLLPILLIFLQWGTIGSGEQDIWQHLLSTKLDRLLLNTVILACGVGAGVTLLGVSLAWLTASCDFPGRRFFDWALMLPLAVPSYVMAFVFLGLFNFAGPVQSTLRAWFGSSGWFPDVQSAPGVIIVFSLVLYPYVYMLARSAFIANGRSMMDAARVLGHSPGRAFRKVAVPVARPAIIAGVALALMETLADFGAVSVFNYDTFTTAIYSAWYGLFNLSVAAQLASLLLLFVALTLYLEKKGRAGARYSQDERSKNLRPYGLKGGRAWAATVACGLVLLLAFGLPFLQLLLWCVEAGVELDSRYWDFLGHTLSLGAIAAALTVAIALLLAFIKQSSARSRIGHSMTAAIRIATLGYALPGSVLAVGIILAFTLLDRSVVATVQGWLGMAPRPLLVGGVFALILAYSIRFLAVAFAPLDAGLERIKPGILESARSLGASPFRLLTRVYIPMLRPGLITALIIVFVDVMKEMPATLVMRPFGWDTLAVQIYQMTAEGQWERAALPGLSLILVGLIPVMLLIKSSRQQQAHQPL